MFLLLFLYCYINALDKWIPVFFFQIKRNIIIRNHSGAFLFIRNRKQMRDLTPCKEDMAGLNYG